MTAEPPALSELRFRWWDKSIGEIDGLIPLLTSGDLEKVRAELKARVGRSG